MLVGIGVGSTLAAFNALLVVRASLTQAQTAASWLAGSLNDITWERTYALMGLLLVVTPLLLMLVRPLGAIRFGDQVASGLGVSVNAYRVAALFIGVLLVSLATATTGRLPLSPWRHRTSRRPCLVVAGWASPPRHLWVRSWCSALT